VNEMPDLTSPRVLRELLKERSLSPKRQWGQNFLIDANIAHKIAASLEAVPGREAIEIGPGAGALTKTLLDKGYRVLALEIDRGLVSLLEEIFMGNGQIQIRQADVLKVNWQELLQEHSAFNNLPKLISNLPYVISGPFIYSILKEALPFSIVVLMLQKEVAWRLVATPGSPDYGALSVICRYYAYGRVLFEVSSNVFWPKPKVGSAVIQLLPGRRSLAPEEEPLFRAIVQGVFQQRRKTIFNNLARLFPDLRDQIDSFCSASGITPTSRPEELDVEQFAKLSRIIYNIHQ